MNKANPTTIRLSITKEVRSALNVAKKRYPALSDPEILKLGLSRIATDHSVTLPFEVDREDIRRTAANSVGKDYLQDPEEDVYSKAIGKKVHFS